MRFYHWFSKKNFVSNLYQKSNTYLYTLRIQITGKSAGLWKNNSSFYHWKASLHKKTVKIRLMNRDCGTGGEGTQLTLAKQ